MRSVTSESVRANQSCRNRKRTAWSVICVKHLNYRCWCFKQTQASCIKCCPFVSTANCPPFLQRYVAYLVHSKGQQQGAKLAFEEKRRRFLVLLRHRRHLPPEPAETHLPWRMELRGYYLTFKNSWQISFSTCGGVVVINKAGSLLLLQIVTLPIKHFITVISHRFLQMFICVR